MLHVKTCTLEVKKAIDGTPYDESDTFLFTVRGADNDLAKEINMTIVIQGESSETITGLPIGTYTVTEDEDWSWRYTSTESNKEKTLSSITPNSSVTITNALEETQWLSHDAMSENNFKSLTNAAAAYLSAVRSAAEALMPNKVTGLEGGDQ